MKPLLSFLLFTTGLIHGADVSFTLNKPGNVSAARLRRARVVDTEQNAFYCQLAESIYRKGATRNGPGRISVIILQKANGISAPLVEVFSLLLKIFRNA